MTSPNTCGLYFLYNTKLLLAIIFIHTHLVMLIFHRKLLAPFL